MLAEWMEGAVIGLNVLSVVAVTVTIALGLPNAEACPVGMGSISISFAGLATPNPAATTWAGATGIQFQAVTVTDAVGVMDPLTGRLSPHADFTFAPSLDPSPVSPLWSVGGFSYTLTTVRVVLQSPTFLVLQGKGYLDGPGFPGRRLPWAFSSQQVGGAFSFASSHAMAEPVTLALLPLGLLGPGWLRRRRRSHGRV